MLDFPDVATPKTTPADTPTNRLLLEPSLFSICIYMMSRVALQAIFVSKLLWMLQYDGKLLLV